MARVNNNWQNKLKDFAFMNMILFGSQKMFGMEDNRATKLIVNEQINNVKTYENSLPGGVTSCKWDCASYCSDKKHNGWFWTTIAAGGASLLTGIGLGIYYLLKSDKTDTISPFCRDLSSKCPDTGLISSINETLQKYKFIEGVDYCFGEMYPIDDKYSYILNNNENCTLNVKKVVLKENDMFSNKLNSKLNSKKNLKFTEGEEEEEEDEDLAAETIFKGQTIEYITPLQVPKNIGSTAYMFGGIKKLKVIDFTKFNVDNVKNTSCMFALKNSLKELKGFDDLDLKYVTDTIGMFSGTNLKEISLNAFRNSKIKNAGYMFAGNDNLEKINNITFLSNGALQNVSSIFLASPNINDYVIRDIEKWNTENLKDASYLFSGLANLNSLNLTSWNTKNLIKTSGMFYDTSLEEIEGLNKLNLQNVVDASSMFAHTALKSIDLAIFGENSKLKYIDNLFYGSSNIEEVKNAGYILTSNIESAQDIFGETDIVSKIIDNITDWNMKLEDASYLFADLNNVDSLNLTKWDTDNIIKAEGMFKNSKITTLILNNFNKLENAYEMFKNAEITNLKIDEKLFFTNLINATSMFEGSILPNIEGELLTLPLRKLVCADSMFGNIDLSNNDLDLSTLSTEKITSAESMFAGSKFGTLKLNNFNKLQNAKEMFKGAEIGTLTFGDDLAFNKLVNATNMFDSSKITTFPSFANFVMENLASVKGMFNNTKADGQTLDLNSLSTVKITDAESMFAGSKFGELKLNNFTNLKNAQNMFKGAEITTLTFGEDLSFPKLENANYMFSGSTITTFPSFEGLEMVNLASVKGMFYNTIATDQALDLSLLNTSKIIDAESMFAGSEFGTLKLNNFNNLKNAKEMFANSAITTLTFENNMKLDNLLNAGSMFEGITTLPIFNNILTSNLNNATRMFAANSLTSLDLSNFASNNLQTIKEMFKDSEYLTSINFGNLETNDNLVTENAFEGCTDLETVLLHVDQNPNIVAKIEEIEGFTCDNTEDKCIKSESGL